MALKSKIYLIIFVILEPVGVLLLLGYVAVQPLGAADAIVGQEISLPSSAPGQQRLTLVSFSPVVIEGQTIGAVAVYDDVTTKRPADHMELYDNTGDLVAVDWFDRFGIERMAVDRGLLEETHRLEGVFVVLVQGDPS